MLFSYSLLSAAGALFAVVSQSSAQKIIGDMSFNFTLAAFNLTLPNANTTGAPLVLGQAGAVDGAEFEVTSTYASFPFNEFPALALHGTSLRAFTSDGQSHTNATAPTSGGTLGWLTTSFQPPPATKGFTALTFPNAKFPQLAFDGHSKLWSLCPFNGGQVNVVFNVSADIPPPPFLQFNPNDCYKVNLNIVPIVSG